MASNNLSVGLVEMIRRGPTENMVAVFEFFGGRVQWPDDYPAYYDETLYVVSLCNAVACSAYSAADAVNNWCDEYIRENRR